MSDPLPNIPAALVAGDSVAWRIGDADHPAPAWTLGYRLINAEAVIDLTATADGDAHLVTVAAATSAAWAPGTYTWTAAFSAGAERHTVGSGSIAIKPNLAAMVSGYDARTSARRALDDARAALATWIATDGHVTEYQIADRQMRFASKADLLARINWLEREVAREEQAERLAAGLSPGRRVLVRF